MGRVAWFRRKGVWLSVLVVSVIVAGTLFWRSGPPDADEQFLFAPVQSGDIEKSIVSSGQLEPKRYVEVGAQVSGQVEAIYVEEGDKVTEGDLLVDIDATVFETQVRKTEAALESKKAQLIQLRAERELAVVRAKRNAELFEQNAVSEDVVVSSNTDVKVLDSRISASIAQIKADEAGLAGDKATLGFARIFAPISGTIASIKVRQGQTLNANQNAPTLMKISDLSVMTLRAEVSEADVQYIHKGMPVYFTTLGNSKKQYHSSVRQVLPTPTEVNDVVLYQVLIDIDNPDGVLMDAMTTQVFFVQSKRENTLVVPLAALKGPPNQRTVMVQTDQGVEPRTVTTGIQNRTSVEILSGLNRGEQIVVGFRSPMGGAASSRGPLGGPPFGPRGR